MTFLSLTQNKHIRFYRGQVEIRPFEKYDEVLHLTATEQHEEFEFSLGLNKKEAQELSRQLWEHSLKLESDEY